MLYTRELPDRMMEEGISRAEFTRRQGVSKVRVTQWLDLLDLPEWVINEAWAKGDNWERRRQTERGLRNRSDKPQRTCQ